MWLGKQSVWKTMFISISKEFGVVAKILFNLHRYANDIQDTESVIGLGFCADFVRLKLYFPFWTLKFRWIYWQIQSFQEMMAKKGRHGFQVALRDQRVIGPYNNLRGHTANSCLPVCKGQMMSIVQFVSKSCPKWQDLLNAEMEERRKGEFRFTRENYLTDPSAGVIGRLSKGPRSSPWSVNMQRFLYRKQWRASLQF